MTRIVVAVLIVFAWLDARAQSSLPPCPSDTPADWTNCFGTFTYENGIQYVGSWKDNKPYGQGSLISSKGYTFVEGFWRDNRTIDVNNLQWTWLGTSNDFSVFVLPESIKQVGAFRRAWVMWANAEPRPNSSILSTRRLENFDCVNDSQQYLSSSAHIGSFGSGTTVYSTNEGERGYVAPGTVLAIVMKYVCEYKL